MSLNELISDLIAIRDEAVEEGFDPDKIKVRSISKTGNTMNNVGFAAGMGKDCFIYTE